jgi:ketol-acid reductoisomerase
MKAVTFFSESDGSTPALAGSTVAVIGYGNLGRPIALNLRDSNVDVIVGNIDDSFRAAAKGDGFATTDIHSAAEQADILYVLVPDEVIPQCYETFIAPVLCPEKALCFASGYVIAFGLVHPPQEVDVLLLAPKMPGGVIRDAYLSGEGFFSVVNAEQDATGNALARVLALARSTGGLRQGAMLLSAKQEAFVDLFIEQSVGPYIGACIQIAFQMGVEAGLPAEALTIEMYMSGEMARTFDLFGRLGFLRSVSLHGAVAQYGGLLRTLSLDRQSIAGLFQETLDDIRSGAFAAKFQQEQLSGYPTFALIESMTSGDDDMSRAEDRVREAMGRLH